MRGSRNFCQGGGGGSLRARKQPGQRVFLLLSFSPQLILQFTEGVQWFYYRENYTFQRIEGVQLIQGGGGGVQGPSVNFYRNPYNVIFRGGPPITPSGSAHGVIAG